MSAGRAPGKIVVDTRPARAGLFFGLAFGAAGIGSALLGWLADHTSIGMVFAVSAYFPLLGLLTAFLPEVEVRRSKTT